MPNKHYSKLNNLKTTDTKTQNTDQSGKGPNNYSGYKAESTANWPGAAGPKGSKRNTNPGMFHEVKQSAKQDMADDLGGGFATGLQRLPPEILPGIGGSGMGIQPISVPPMIGNPGMGILPAPVPGLRIGGGRRRNGDGNRRGNY